MGVWGGGGGNPSPRGIGGGMGGASANSWWGLSVGKSGFCAANSLSAAVPCLSPLASFLKAYETDIGLLQRYCPFIASMAASLASKLAKLTKAKPLEFPESGSRIIFGTCKITPNALKVS